MELTRLEHTNNVVQVLQDAIESAREKEAVNVFILLTNHKSTMPTAYELSTTLIGDLFCTLLQVSMQTVQRDPGPSVMRLSELLGALRG